MLAHLVDLDDPRMLELGDSLRFDRESRKLLGRRVAAAEHHFQCDQAVEADLRCLVNDPHATPADDIEDHVAWHVRPDPPAARPGQFRPVRRGVVGGRGGSIDRNEVARFVLVGRLATRGRRGRGVPLLLLGRLLQARCRGVQMEAESRRG